MCPTPHAPASSCLVRPVPPSHRYILPPPRLGGAHLRYIFRAAPGARCVYLWLEVEIWMEVERSTEITSVFDATWSQRAQDVKIAAEAREAAGLNGA